MSLAESGREALAGLQAWLQGRILGGSWGLAGDEADAERHIVSSETLPAQARLDIYARSYVMRLAECLRAEFPVLRALVGDTVFNLFAGGYLSARPPASYSLYDLGAGFADYLEASRPRPHTGPGTLEALPASLARLERALSEAARAPGVESHGPLAMPPDILALLPAPAGLRTPQTLKLLKLDFDLIPALDSARSGRRPDPPEPRESYVAVARTAYRVRAHRLEPWAFAWLAALGESGDDGQAVRAAAGASGRTPAQVRAGLPAWLPGAMACGLVTTAGQAARVDTM